MRKNNKRVAVLILIFTMLSSTVCVYAEENVVEPEKTSIMECVIGTIKTMTFDGELQEPKLTIYDGTYELIEGQDFTVIYQDNMNAGTGKAVVYGQGNYSGSVIKEYTIEKASAVISGGHTLSGKPKVSWDKVDGAVKYEVYRATTKNGTYSKRFTTVNTSYTNTNAQTGKRYYYKVIAVDGKGQKKNFTYSNVISLYSKLSAPKVKASNIASSGKVKLTWEKVSGADKYLVYRSTKKESGYTLRLSTKNKNYTNTNAVAGKKYYYKVKAVDSDNRNADSLYCEPVLRTCDLKRPVISTITLNNKAKPKITWKKISGAEKYEVFRSVKNGTYKSIGKTSKLYYTDTTAKGGNTYYYKVRAIDEDRSAANSAKSTYKKIYAVNLNKKLVALTFDDGPGPYTKDIVQKLKANNAKATFFVLGNRVSTYSDVLKYTYDQGCEIGNHSYDHTILSEVGSSTIKSQMSKTDNAIKKIIGVSPVLMRPPGGGVSSTVKSHVGKPIIYWSIDTLDWKTRSKSETVNCVMNNVRDGSIVLMHDIHEPTKEAALELIPKLKNKGYELVTVSEMAKFKGKELKEGVVYYSF